jgi:hypothetical protein
MQNISKSFPIYPILFAAYSILFIYNNNIDELSLSQIFLPIVGIILLSVIVWAGMRLFIKDNQKAACIASIFIFFFISYGFWGRLIDNNICLEKKLFGFWGYNKVAYISLGSIFAAITLIIVISKKKFNNISKYLNITSLMLIVFILVSITNKSLNFKKYHSKNSIEEQCQANCVMANFDNKSPDIYYIILDAYTSSNILKNDLGFDNKEFETFLKSKGFKIADKSHANYGTTLTSLSSSLNMDYHSNLGVNLKDRIKKDYFYNLIKQNRVWMFLRKHGYRMFVCSSYALSGYYYNDNRVVNCSPEKFSENFLGRFSVFILENSPVAVLFKSPMSKHRQDIKYSFEKLKEIINAPGPKFVFFHILSPHPPYVFGPDGGAVKKDSKGLQRYVDQIIFTNKMMESCVEDILHKTNKNVVIVIQGDHGLFPLIWDLKNDIIVNQRMQIFNAFYSKECDSCFYDSITPVNSFRKILNYYFHANMPYLPDSSFAFETYSQQVWNMFNVTDRLKWPQ